MAEIVNLRRARKGRAKAEKDKAAEANRAFHGTPKKLLNLTKARGEKAARELAGRKLEPGPDK